MSEINPPPHLGLGLASRIMLWLSTVDPEVVQRCPVMERRFYECLGASILASTLFVMTLVSVAFYTAGIDNFLLLAPITVVWGFVSMTANRLLVSTYRYYAGFKRRLKIFFVQLGLSAIGWIAVVQLLCLSVVGRLYSGERADESIIERFLDYYRIDDDLAARIAILIFFVVGFSLIESMPYIWRNLFTTSVYERYQEFVEKWSSQYHRLYHEKMEEFFRLQTSESLSRHTIEEFREYQEEQEKILRKEFELVSDYMGRVGEDLKTNEQQIIEAALKREGENLKDG